MEVETERGLWGTGQRIRQYGRRRDWGGGQSWRDSQPTGAEDAIESGQKEVQQGHSEQDRDITPGNSGLTLPLTLETLK